MEENKELRNLKNNVDSWIKQTNERLRELEGYGKNLNQIKDQVTRERLMLGLWEYSSDPSTIMEYDKIIDIFTNKFIKKDTENKYITCDPARGGRDNAVIMVWHGLYMVKMYVHGKCKMPFLEGEIDRIATI